MISHSIEFSQHFFFYYHSTKMALMEKQLESLTELVKELTNPTKSKTLLDSYDKSLHQQLYELKLKTQTLRNDLFSIRRMQQSLQETVKNELARANKQIQVIL